MKQVNGLRRILMRSLKLLRKYTGCRYRYYPNCEASIWLCQLLNRRSLTKGQIEGFRKFLGMQIDIEI